jgi:hypothetical protein
MRKWFAGLEAAMLRGLFDGDGERGGLMVLEKLGSYITFMDSTLSRRLGVVPSRSKATTQCLRRLALPKGPLMTVNPDD